ncbi:MAG: CopD family protein [Polyangiaceae bacterium]|nr:CopD family protein [Polyangiaceae bacterium]
MFLHVLAAAAWIGGMAFFAAVIVPTLRAPEVRGSASTLLRALGARFRVFGWVSLGALIVTGVTNLWLRGIGWQALSSREFWAMGFGRVLAWKLAVVGVVGALTLGHELLASRRNLDLLDRDPVAGERFRRRASLLGRVVMLLSLVILYLAVALVRGSLG